jgi:hypothetical protein
VPDTFVVSFDEKHVGIIDTMAVEEGRNFDVANANAF